ncbi:D-alanyl-D-alanine carboxypeptidase family protein [Coxiella endosymbiont of Amblyomma nuttalli]|uniref:D-alanyl-D-alanine carboxypeptidase family protein n=1 Tax=Coxiella endosymbiont of Amblyomma nuttalli TaxID=2749996 RepID=UPI001BADACE1|nr:D-alanyl-D-alanine carboxypeptidase family protein [Coxiella endosymbiont of Amblyomma nuttalli]QTS84048.1 D-alanyl-D-alanine carboxypeptidase DacC precursor [Coxiella endosymbiont of Amblyomma nuttalli]
MKSITTLFFCMGFISVLTTDAANTGQQNLALINCTTQQFAVPPCVVPPPNIGVKGYILMDSNSGTVIAEKNMNQRLQPASLTKLMTLYIAFQALKSGQIHLDNKATVSIKAWRTGGSRMFLKEGSAVPISLLIQGIIVASGNDACVTIAQCIAGTEQSFAQMMNQTARHLGMKNSHYVDSTGLPRPDHYSTPYDMALLTCAIINNFPEYYHFFSQKWLTYNNIKQPNRNRLLWWDTSTDGLKTGHTNEAGYSLISSAKRNDMRLIAVVMGAQTDNERIDDSEALLDYGFRCYQTQLLFSANKAVTKRRIWLGKERYIGFGLENPLYVTTPVNDYKNLQASLQIDQNLRAPILKGQVCGKITVTLCSKPIIQAPLIALQNDSLANIFSRIWDYIALFFKEIF